MSGYRIEAYLDEPIVGPRRAMMLAFCTECGAEYVLEVESPAQETSVRRQLEEAGRRHLAEAHGLR